MRAEDRQHRKALAAARASQDIHIQSPTTTGTLDLVEPRIELEKLLLASILADPKWLAIVQRRAKVTDFTVDIHRRIYQAMLDLYEAGVAFDYMVLADRVEEVHGPLEYFGCRILVHLTGLDIETPRNPRREGWLEKVVERGTRVELCQLAEQLQGAARGQLVPLSAAAGHADGDATPQAIVDATLVELGSIALRTSQRDALDLEQALQEAAADWQMRTELDCDLIGAPFGLVDLDEMTLGMAPADLIILGGRPGSGKTAFACGVALHNARVGNKVLFLSLEMRRLAIVHRMLAAISGINQRKIRLGRMSDWEAERLAAVYRDLAPLPLRIEQIGRTLGPPTVSEMIAEARRFAATWGGLDLLVVDYLQAISPRPGTRVPTDYERVTQVTQDVKLRLCNALEVPVLALCALKKGNAEPTIDDLKGTGEIASRADLVIMVDRPEMRSPNDPALQGLGVALIEKSRNDTMGRIELGFDGPCQRWRSLAPAPIHSPEQRQIW